MCSIVDLSLGLDDSKKNTYIGIKSFEFLNIYYNGNIHGIEIYMEWKYNGNI